MRELKEISRDLELNNQNILELLHQHLSLKAEAMEAKKEGRLPILGDQSEPGGKMSIPGLKDSPYEDELQEIFHTIETAGKRVGSKCLFDFNIALIGFMGAGKSTVSRYLKDQLAMEEVDVDAMIVEDQNMAIKDIFAEHGEEYFRKCESEAIIRLKDCRQSVISCGGGAVIREENVANLKKISRIVLLTAAPETILSRVRTSDERPILNGNMNVEFIKELMAKRADYYRKAADVMIETDHKTMNQICEELIQALILLKEQEKK